MPWSDFGNDVRQFSGMVEWAVRQGVTTTQMSQLFAESARAAGMTGFGFKFYQDLARLYGVHSRLYKGAQDFQAAYLEIQRTGIDQAVTGRMINPYPWSPGTAEWSLNPRVNAKVQYTKDTPMGPRAGFYEMKLRQDDLSTIGDLMDEAQTRLDTSDTESPPREATLTGYVELGWR